MGRIALTVVVIFFYHIIEAQEAFTLEECIVYATENHPDITQKEVAARQSDVRHKQAKNDLLPALNLGMNHNYSLGSTINPSTNSRAPLNIQNDQFYAGLEIELFNWANYLKISLRESEIRESMKQQQVVKQQLTLRVINDFYQYQYNKALQRVLTSQLKGIEDQINRTTEEVQIGTRPQSDIYDIKANLGNIKQAWVQARKQTAISKNNLFATMSMPVRNAEFVLNEELFIKNSVKENVDIEKQPIIETYSLLLEQEDKRIKLAKAVGLPTLFGSYQWSSFYSRELNSENNIGFTEQLSQNRNQFIGIGINIPIFNKKRNYSETQLAQLNKENILAEQERIKLELSQTIENIASNYQYALEEYTLISSNFENQRLSYLRSEEKFKEGLIDSYTFFIVQNNWLDANYNLIRSKYDVMLQQDLFRVFSAH